MRILASYCISPITLNIFAESILAQTKKPINDVDTWVDFDSNNLMDYSLARARNRCIDKAVSGGFDVLLMLDSDTVVEEIPQEWPAFQRALIRDYPHIGAPYQPGGHYAVRRDVFTTHRWCEDFKGFYFSDSDYLCNVCSDVEITVNEHFKLFHMPHAPRGREYGETMRNDALFKSRVSERLIRESRR